MGPVTEHEFDGQVLRFCVQAPADVADQIQMHFARGGPSRPVTVRLVLVVDGPRLEQRAQLLDRHPQSVAQGHPELPYHRWSVTPDVQVLLPHRGAPHLIEVTHRSSGAEVLILAEEEATVARTAIRVMRQLMIRTAEQAGGVLGHTAAVVLDEQAILVAGRPGAGKTTVALGLAERHGAALCAADRCLLLPLGRGGWRVIAVPLAWRIAPGTAGALAPLQRALAEGFTPRRGAKLRDGKHEFVVDELADVLGVPTIAAAPVAGVVALTRDADCETALAAVPEGLRGDVVAGTVLRAEDALFTTDWLGLAAPERVATMARSAAFAAATPVYATSWAQHGDLAALAEQIAGQFLGAGRVH